jgi:hypothetical protein
MGCGRTDTSTAQECFGPKRKIELDGYIHVECRS